MCSFLQAKETSSLLLSCNEPNQSRTVRTDVIAEAAPTLEKAISQTDKWQY